MAKFKEGDIVNIGCARLKRILRVCATTYRVSKIGYSVDDPRLKMDADYDQAFEDIESFDKSHSLYIPPKSYAEAMKEKAKKSKLQIWREKFSNWIDRIYDSL